MASGAVQQCPNCCVSICAEKAKVKMFQEEHALAAAAYDDPGSRKVPGYEEVTDPAALLKLGLYPQDINPSDSDFRAAVFKKANPDGTIEYKVAFKGTSSFEDWGQNFSQGLGKESAYYSRAQLMAKAIAKSPAIREGASIKYLGHSLGGGLASAASHATGAPATTFNAAGLHDRNRRPDGADYPPPAIDAVRVDGEVLSSFQDGAGAVGLAPEAVGTPYHLRPPGGVFSALDHTDFITRNPFVPPKVKLAAKAAALARAVYLHLNGALKDSLQQRHTDLASQASAKGCAC